MKHHTKEKGDIAVLKAMCDLRSKGYYIFNSTTEHLPFDFIIFKSNQIYRIQVKYLKNSPALIPNKTNWADRNGSHSRKYNENDFDYYALYNPESEIIIYPSIKFAGKTIRFKETKNKSPSYWYEDFLQLTDTAEKRIFRKNKPSSSAHKAACKRYREKVKNKDINSYKPKPHTRKVIRPSKDELEKLIWSKPTSTIAKEFGVSDNAIAKWCKNYDIIKPSRGYWSIRYPNRNSNTVTMVTTIKS